MDISGEMHLDVVSTHLAATRCTGAPVTLTVGYFVVAHTQIAMLWDKMQSILQQNRALLYHRSAMISRSSVWESLVLQYPKQNSTMSSIRREAKTSILQAVAAAMELKASSSSVATLVRT